MRTLTMSLLAMALVLGLASGASAQRCFVAYVHGRGDDLTGHTQDQLEAEYWSLGNTYSSATYYGATVRGCTVFRVGYDGSSAFWDSRAAGSVASQINGFISQQGIQAGELIIVAHSMGGLVVRWIMNNGVAGAPYYNYAGQNYAQIVSRTHHFITIQSPHMGTEAADALFGEADSWYSDALGGITTFFGIDSGDAAANAMRRQYMHDAGSSWMGDGGRTRRMYTIAGFTTFSGSGNGETNDGLLELAWGGICNRSHAVNLWLCGEDDYEAGDGLVEENSAMGRYRHYDSGSWYLAYLDAGWVGDSNYVTGARTDWLRVEHNHQQGRHDQLSARIRNCTSMSCGTRSSQSSTMTTTSWVNSYIGSYIRGLAS